MNSRRKFLLGAVALAGGAIAVRRIISEFAPLPEFEPIAGLPGFRKIAGGPSSVSFNPLFGLENRTEPLSVSVEDVKADLCISLYGDVDFGGDVVPIASFSDYYCPYCRLQTLRLPDVISKYGNGVRIVWHELPLLGDPSRMAAKAALAAKMQGAYLEFHEHLLSSPFRVTPQYLDQLADTLDIDPERLKADMKSDAVETELATSLALSKIFAIIGTPALVIGRTVIQGRVPDATIRTIVELEKSQNWSEVC